MELFLAVLLAACLVALASTYSALRTERARARRAEDRLGVARLDPPPSLVEADAPLAVPAQPGSLPAVVTPPAAPLPATAPPDLSSAASDRLAASLIGPAERLAASIDAAGPVAAAAASRLRSPLPPVVPAPALEEAPLPELSPETVERALVVAERLSDERTRLADDVRSLRAALERVAALGDGTERAVTELARSVDALLPLSSSVSGLADRANLLGLNVSLLAARAGEAGAPFEEAAAELRGLFEEARRLSRDLSEAGRRTEAGARRVTSVVEESSEAAVAGIERGSRAAERPGALDGLCGQMERALTEAVRSVRSAADADVSVARRLDAARSTIEARTSEAARLRAEAEAAREALRAVAERIEALRLDGNALRAAVTRATSGA